MCANLNNIIDCLNYKVKYSSPVSFKCTPVQEASINYTSCYRLAIFESQLFFNASEKKFMFFLHNNTIQIQKNVIIYGVSLFMEYFVNRQSVNRQKFGIPMDLWLVQRMKENKEKFPQKGINTHYIHIF